MAQPAPAANNQGKAILPVPPAPAPLPAGAKVFGHGDQETPEETTRKITYRADLIEKRGGDIIAQIEDLNDQKINRLGDELVKRLLKIYEEKSTGKTLLFMKPEEEKNFQRLKDAIIKLTQITEFELSNSNIASLRMALELSTEKKLPILLKSALEIIKSTNVIDQVFCSLSEEKALKLKKNLIAYFTEVLPKSDSSAYEPYLETIVDTKFITNLNLNTLDKKIIVDALNKNPLIISYKASIKHINAQALAPEEKKNLILEEQLKLLKNPTLFAFSLFSNANNAETTIKEAIPYAVKKYNASLATLVKEINKNNSDSEKIEPAFFDAHERNESALRAIINCNRIAKVNVEAEILKLELNPLSLQIILKYYAENKTASALPVNISKYLLTQITTNKIKLDSLQNPDNLFLGIQNSVGQGHIPNDILINLLLFTNQKISNSSENNQSNLFILNKKLQTEILSNLPIKNIIALFKTVFEKIVSSNNDKEQLNLAKLSKTILHEINHRESYHISANLNLKMDQAIYDNRIGIDARKEFIEERIDAQKMQVGNQANIFIALLRAPQIIGFDNIKLSVVNYWQRAMYDKDLPLTLKLEIAQGITQTLAIFPFHYNSQTNILFMGNINQLLPEIYSSKLSQEEKLKALGIISTMMAFDMSAIYQIDPNHLYQFFQDKNLDEEIRIRAASILSVNLNAEVHPFEFTEKHLALFRENFSNPNIKEELQLSSLRIYHKLLDKVDWPEQKAEMSQLMDVLIKRVFDPQLSVSVKEQLFALFENEIITKNLREISDAKNNNLNKIMNQLKADLQSKKNEGNYHFQVTCLRLMLKIYPENRKKEVMGYTKELMNKLYQFSSEHGNYIVAENAIINLILALKKDFKDECNKFFDEKIKETEKNEDDTQNWKKYKSYLNGAPIPV